MVEKVSLNWITNIEESTLEDIRSSISAFFQKFQSLASVTVTHYEFDQKNLVEIGNNYMSGLFLLKLHLWDKIREHERSVVVKIPQFGSSYKLVSTFRFFEKESYMYERILPRMAELHGSSFSPICYSVSKSGILFLENLLGAGFKVRENKKLLDKDHCEIAFRALGQFHATSLKYLQENGNEIDTFSEMDLSKSPEIRIFMTSAITSFLENIVSFTPKRMFEKIEMYFKNYEITSRELRSPNSDGLNVICHGDFWLNNFMFNYDQSKLVRSLKMIDFQMSLRTSPLSDLLYLLITSVPFKVFHENQESLIELYLREFNKKSEALGCGVRFSRNEFNQHLIKYLKIMTLFVLGVTVPIIRSNRSTIFVDDGKVENYCKSQDFILVCTDWLNYVDVKTDFFK